MMRIMVPVVALAAAALVPVTVSAQPPMPNLPRLFGNFAPKTGVWSEYSLQEKGSDRTTTMKLSIVGEEEGAYWYEVHFSDGSTRNVVKMFVTGDPGDPENIRRLIVKSGEGQAVEMPRDFVVMGRRMATHMFESRSGVPAESPAEIRVEELGEGEVTVPAGTFKVQKRRITDAKGAVLGSYDFSAAVQPIGVVASDTPENSMELLAHGSDARSAITEEPVPMQPPPGMPPGMGPGMRGGPPQPPPSGP